MNNLQPPDDARSSMKMLGTCMILFLAFIIAATGYFGGRALYFWGYNTGYEANKPTQQACMEYVIKYGGRK
jgi:hypothetical protein